MSFATTRPHTAKIVAVQKPDGIHVRHENGARVVIPIAKFMRWCLAELKRAS